MNWINLQEKNPIREFSRIFFPTLKIITKKRWTPFKYNKTEGISKVVPSISWILGNTISIWQHRMIISYITSIRSNIFHFRWIYIREQRGVMTSKVGTRPAVLWDGYELPGAFWGWSSVKKFDTVIWWIFHRMGIIRDGPKRSGTSWGNHLGDVKRNMSEFERWRCYAGWRHRLSLVFYLWRHYFHSVDN